MLSAASWSRLDLNGLFSGSIHSTSRTVVTHEYGRWAAILKSKIGRGDATVVPREKAHKRR
jgi:hypothetical protein